MGDEIKFTITAFDKFSKPFKKIQNRINRLVTPIQRVNLNMRRLAKVAGLDRIAGRFKNMTKSVQRFNRVLRTTGIAVGAFGLALVPAFRFEAQMSRVKAVTSTAGKEFERLNKEAKRLGETTLFSATKVAEGMTFLGMAGQSTGEILASIKPVLDLAKVGNIELGEAADIVTGAMGGFSIAATDTKRVADVLAVAATDSKLTINDMGEAMKFAGSVAGQLGGSLEETIAFMESLATVNIRGSLAGTQLRKMFVSLVKPVGDGKKAVKGLRLQIEEARGDFIPLIEIMSDLEKKISKLGQVRRARIVADIFGIRALGALEILKGIKTGDIFTKLAALKDANGAAERMARTISDNVLGSFTLWLSALEGTSVALSEVFNPAIRGATDALIEATGEVTAWIKANPELTKTIAKVALIVAGLTVAFAALGVVIAVVTFALGALFTPIGLIIAGLVGAALIVRKTWQPIIFLFEKLGGLLKVIGRGIVGVRGGEFNIGTGTQIPGLQTTGPTVAATTTQRNESLLRVIFDNAPKGTRTESEKILGNIGLDLDMGISMTA